MALVHCDPFAHYTSAQYTDIYSAGPGGASLAIGAYGPGGRPGLRFSGDLNDSIVRTVTTSGAVCAFQADLRISAAPSGTNVLFAILLSASVQCSVDIKSDRTLAVHRGFAGTKTQLGSASSYVVPLDTFIHIGVTFTLGNGTSGSIVVHVWEDGDTAAQVVLNVTGVDTQEGVSATWDSFDLGAGCDGTTDWANFIVMDGSGSSANALLGPADVSALWANARTTPSLTDWSLSTGSDVSALVDDDTPDDDTTYLEETTQDEQMTVAVDPVPYRTRPIHGAQLYASVKLTSGSPSLRGIGYDGSSHLGVTFAPTANYTYLMGPYSAMPDGSAFSTAAAFDALQWGLKLTTSSTGVRVTQIVVALIQTRTSSKRNLATGYGHTVTGDDNLAAGRENTVTGSNSQAHGSGATVVGDRSVLFNLDGVPRTLTGNGKFEVYGEIGGDLAAAIGLTGQLIGVQVISATGAGTYTPTSGTGAVVIELQGGGGGGGAVPSPGTTQIAFARGGSAGAYLVARLTSAFSGAAYVVGAKGTGGTAGANAGNNGVATTFTATGGGTVYTAGPGLGGNAGAAATAPAIGATMAGGTATNGDVNRPGGNSFSGFAIGANNVLGGGGGESFYAPGARAAAINGTNQTAAGVAAIGKGGGGSGGVANGSGAAAAGGDGSDGILIIWEYGT